MAVSTAELKILLAAQDQASGVLKTVGGELNALHKTATATTGGMASMGKSVLSAVNPFHLVGGAMRGVVGVGGAVVSSAANAGVALAGMGMNATVATAGVIALTAAVGGVVKSAADFDKQMSAIGAVTGASAEEMKQLDALALKLGADTAYSASEAARGIEELAKAGVSLADIMGGGAAATLDLAAAGGVEVAEAATIASNALNAFKLSGSDMAHVADVIAGAANASAIDVREFGFSLQMSGAVAATVGIKFDDLATAIALMGNAGIKGSDAGTSLKTMLLNLHPQTDKAAGLMKELGIITATGANQFFDAAGNAKGLADISQVLANATANMTREQKLATLEMLFGTDAIRAAAILTDAGAKGFTDLATAMGKVGAQDVANKRLDNLWGDLEKLKGSLETAAIIIGRAFTPSLRLIVQALTDILNANMANITTMANTMGEAFARAMPKVGAFFAFVGEKGVPALRTLFTLMLTIAGGPFSLFMAAWPLLQRSGGGFIAWLRGPAITALNDLNDMLVGQLNKAFQWFSSKAWPMLSSAGARAMAWVHGTALPVLQSLAQQIGTRLVAAVGVGIAIWPRILAAIRGVADFIGTQVIPRVQALADWLGPRLERTSGAAMSMWPNIQAAAALFVGFVQGTLLPALGRFIDAIGPRLASAFNWLITTGWTSLGAAATTFVGFLEGSVLPALYRLWDWLSPKLGAAFVWLSTQGFPMLATGGAAFIAWITGTAIPRITDLWNWLYPKLQAAFNWLTTQAWPRVASAGAVFTDWIKGTAVPRLQDLWEWLQPKLQAAFDWLSTRAWPGVKTAAATTINWFGDTAIPKLQELAGWLQPKIQAAVAWWQGTAWPGIKAAAVSVIGWINDTAIPALQKVAEWLQPKLEAAYTWWATTAWPGIRAAAVSAVDYWNGTLLPALQNIAEWLQPKLQAAYDWWVGTAWPTIQSAAAGFVNWYYERLAPAFANLIAWLDEHVRPAVDYLANTGFPALAQASSDLASVVDKQLNPSWEHFNEVIQKTPAYISALKIIDDLRVIIDKLWPLVEKLTGWIDKLREAAGGAKEPVDLLQIAVDALLAPFAAVLKPIEAFVGFLRNIVELGDAAAGAIRKVIESLMIGGLTKGIPALTPANFTPTGGGGQLPAIVGDAGLGRIAGGGGRASMYADAILAASGATGVPADVIAGILDTEGSGETSISPAGARGVMQVVPGQGYDLPGENWMDPATSIMQGARALLDKYNITGDWEKAMAAYFGYGTDAGGMTTGRYLDIAKANRAKYAPTAAIPRTPQIGQASLGLSPGDALAACGPAALEWFMNQTGRTPNSGEAFALAKQFGWTQTGGMNGFYNFVSAARAAGITGAANYTPTRTDIQGLLDSGVPFVLSTLGHYFQVQGGTLAGLNVGASGTALLGGAETMSLDLIEQMTGPINGVIQLYGEMGAAATAGGEQVIQATRQMGSATADLVNPTRETEVAYQTLMDIASRGFPQATGVGADALRSFGMASQGVVDDMLAGNITLDDAKLKLIEYASTTGLATDPLNRLNAGLATQDQALKSVLFAAAQVNPAYTETALAFANGAISADTATLNFLQLAASTKGVTDAVVSAQQGLTNFASYMPAFNTLVQTGSLTGDGFNRMLIGLANSSGLVKSTLDLQTASTSELTAELFRVMDGIAEADPRFQALSQTVRAQGGFTTATTAEFFKLMGQLTATAATASTTAGVVKNEATPATKDLGVTTAATRQLVADSWQAIQVVVRAAASNMENSIKTAVNNIKSALQSISSVKVSVDVSSAVKSLGKIEDAADDAYAALRKVGASAGKYASSRAMGGPVKMGQAYLVGEAGPELFLPHQNGVIIPNGTFLDATSGYAAAGGGQIVINVNAPVYGVDDMESVVVRAIGQAQRRGRL